jgi:hypothetical protein
MMKPEQQKKFDDMMVKMTNDGVREWMAQTIASVESDLRDMRSFTARMEEALTPTVDVPERSAVTPTEVLTWFVSRAAQVGSNMRLGSAVRHATALTTIAHKKEG